MRDTVFCKALFMTSPPHLTTTLEKISYDSFLGIVMKRDHDKVLEILGQADWNPYRYQPHRQGMNRSGFV